VIVHGTAVAEQRVNPAPLGAADTSFGLGVLGAWCQAQPGQNLVFSPATLASALDMAYLGARGQAAQTMAQVLRLPASQGQPLLAAFQARTRDLGSLNGPGVTLDGYNQVWADPGLPLSATYLNSVATAFGAGVAQAPFSSSPQQAAGEVNQAVSAATHGKIPQLLSPGALSGVQWVLTAALYLKATWATPFSPGETATGSFAPADGAPVTADFMNGPGFTQSQAAGWTAVSLPYQGGTLAMTALLPPSGSGACALPSTATLATVEAELARGGTGTASVSIPKLDLTTSGDMSTVLKALGMEPALDSSADFTGLSARAGGIHFVQQAATLQMTETGTTAAAAAAVGGVGAAAPSPRQVVFNRPYLLVVSAATTGEPLFMVKVANPAAH
jgi:serpin B